MTKTLLTFWLLLASIAALAQPADGQFIHSPTITPGCNGVVTSSAKLANGDVIFGGTFTRCAAIRANRVVRFDGSQFFPLGGGAENGVNGGVRAVFVEGSKIYVGGVFSAAGSVAANNVAVFEGGIWRSVGRGASNGVTGVVRSLQVYQGKLYVGGYDANLSGALSPLLREWNGSVWRNLVEFEAQTSVLGSINAMEVGNGLLYFGGTFKPLSVGALRFVGTYDGALINYQNFPAIGGNSFHTVRDLHWFQGRICVGGGFALSDNLTAGVACKTTNSWQGYGLLRNIRTLTDDGAALWAAGLDDPGSNPSVYTVGGNTFARAERQPGDLILTITFQNGALILGGAMAQTLSPAFGLVRLRSGSFEPVFSGSPPALYGSVDTLASGGDAVFAIAQFGFPHPLTFFQLAQRVNEQWQNIPNPPTVLDVNGGSLLTVNGKLHFSRFDSGVYAWTGSQWMTVSDSISANASYGDSLVNIGAPDVDGRRLVQRLGPAGPELLVEIPSLKRNGQRIPFAPTLVEYQGRPVIAGPFDEIEGVGAVGGVASYYDGAWHPLGTQGLRDPKWTSPNTYLSIRLLVLGNELYASNGFTEADGLPVDGIARFDGSRWQPLGPGIVQSNNVAARADVKMIGYQGSVYAYGVFDRAGGQAARNIAQWDGARWRTLGNADAEGLSSDGNLQAAVVNGELHLSGEIHEAGAEPADFYAIWRGSDRIFASGFE